MIQRRQGTTASGAGQAGAARRRRARWPIVLVLVWASFAVADGVFVLASGATSAPQPGRQHLTSGAASPHHSVRRQQRHLPSATLPVRPSPHLSPAVTSLAPVSIAAFGPGGTASGDNPGNASLAVDGSLGTAWLSDWYRSARFGNLQSGTGLLLDMGHPVSVTGVRILLGNQSGADLTLVAEQVPAVPARQNQASASASASDVGGAVRLSLASSRPARYLLIWFTLLPPDSAGTFQASVYNISIDGTP